MLPLLSSTEAGHRQHRGQPVASRPTRARARSARRPSVRQRLRYRFDNSLAHGPLALIGWLGAVVVIVIVVAALVGHFLLKGVGGGFVEDFWQSVIRVLDASAFESESAWPSRVVGLVVTILGIFLGGSLIGLIATVLDQRVANLSKGRALCSKPGTRSSSAGRPACR